ncbi:MAG: organoarsenical effux MFS transporter ArsJ, partial [Verrucomicrobiota bacterium]
MSSDTPSIRGYSLVTAAYWGFTITDGALRMLVLLHFHDKGFSPVTLAFLFLLYEFCGVITNLVGGWIGARFGLRITLFVGLALQIIALVLLAQVQDAWGIWLAAAFVMGTQALSGVAKDLTKMSSKSAVKLLAPGDDQDSKLFKWVALLTGSKNALKGIGFFVGALLLAQLGFDQSLYAMAAGLFIVWIICLLGLRQEIGKAKKKVKFTQIFSKDRRINWLSTARFFLFASRDIWFVVGLPVFLHDKAGLGWSFEQVGAFMAAWVIGYGVVQAAVPGFTKGSQKSGSELGGTLALVWAFVLFGVTAGIAAAVTFEFHIMWSVLIGLGIF